MCLGSARRKLLCSKQFNPSNELEVFAVFSARLLLELGVSNAANRLAREAVNNHMRVLIGAMDYDILVTDAPSEPILAIAASSILLSNEKQYRTAIETLVRALILKGLVLERGIQGELSARILLMVARDAALPRTSKGEICICTEDVRGNLMIQTIRLEEFLVALLGPNLGAATSADKRKAKSLLEWAAPFHLNFTHFIQLETSVHELSPEFLFKCWCRGVGIMCKFHQPIYDILLVVYRGPLSKPFDVKNLGFVTIQVKLRTQAAEKSLVEQLTCPVVLYDGERSKPEHLAILMDLGAQASFKDGGYCSVELGAMKKPSEKQPAAKLHYLGEADEKPRYTLNIRGCKHYAVMGKDGLAGSLVDVFKNLYQIAPPEFRELADSMVATLKRTENLGTKINTDL